ncbi:MAG: TetR/AcrR family transcriptional regulator [Candidatus Goldbacteria bacterium]|nr:TetR/AcrR family transcriptional regulator [Candidatus Goldiibacteriota bacterium]
MSKQKVVQNSKEKILKAAIDEFIEYGFFGARMHRIAKTAGVNKALLHYYFSSKQKLYEHVLDEVTEIILSKINKIENDEKNIQEKIEELLDVYIDIFKNNRDYARMLVYEVIRGGKEIRKILIKKLNRIPFNPVNGKIYNYFKKKIKSGEIKKCNIFQLIISIISQIAPIYVGKEILKDVACGFGIEKLIFEKMVNERKKFVLELTLNGILNKKE